MSSLPRGRLILIGRIPPKSPKPMRRCLTFRVIRVQPAKVYTTTIPASSSRASADLPNCA